MLFQRIPNATALMTLTVLRPWDTCNPTSSPLYPPYRRGKAFLPGGPALRRVRAALSCGVHCKNYHRAPPPVCSELYFLLYAALIASRKDALVQNFLDHINFQSYIIRPSSFLEEYSDWWANRRANKALSLQWTCLLLTVCACSTQQAQYQLRQRLELELGEQLEKASDRYHCTARELHAAIPISCWGITSLQLLMYFCLWYTCEARFIQSWHALNVATRLAQELRKQPSRDAIRAVLTYKGMDQEKLAGTMSEFDCEMRRRLWCLLGTWDW